MPAYKAIPAITESTLANGDLLYWHAADAEYKKLAVGSDTHVLTLASGLPTWAAGGGGGSTTDDNHIYLRYTANYAVANNTWTALEWDSGVTVVDPQTMLFDTVTYPERIRPTATGRYLVTLNVRWADNSTSRRIIELRHRNSSDETLNRAAIQVSAQYGSENSAAGIFEVTTANSEYFFARVYQASGGSLNLLGTTTPAGSSDEEFTTLTVQRLSA